MSSTKKPVRRGARQKKQILDEQDLQKHEEFQKAVEEGRVKQQMGDIFDTAKLQKNYFVRQENKPQAHESQVFNFDQEGPSNSYQSQSETKQQTEVTQKSTAKKRDYRRRKKNNNIFDQEDELQMNSEIKTQQNTDAKLLSQSQQTEQVLQQRNAIQGKKLQFEKQEMQMKKQQKRQVHQKAQQKQPKQQQKPKQQQPTPNQQQQQQSSAEQDDFNNIIKQKQEESQQEQEKIFMLHKHIQKMSKQDKKDFYYQTLPPNTVAYGFFKRFSSGLSDVYQFCGEDHRPLLFCQNQRGCIGANYYISITKEMDKNNVNYLGKLRGNAAGSIYYLYDDGIQPKNQMNRSDWRVTMAAIQYQNNFMGMNGPRKIKVTTPNAKLLQDADTYKLSQQQSLLNFQPPVITRFRNKTPKWNQRLKSYALNFGGRVKLASIKNFILIDNSYSLQQEDQADNIIVFGKVDENTFSVQFRYPLSLFQAFGIVMSEFDFKINCE